VAVKGSTKILIVDDMPTSRQAARTLLHQMGLKKTTEVTNGEAALEKLRSDKFGLVLCELKVEKLNGLELATVMKQTNELAKIPFILMTGDTKKDLILKANQIGVKNILVKPFSQQSLTEVLIKVFN
tara:strand:+ start:72495 stop:72875 length:381 start_codon:yes stop_codon:yes gene_type:complete